MNITVNLISPFQKPGDSAKLVVFQNMAPYVEQEHGDLLINSCMAYAKKYQVYLVSCLFEAMEGLCLALLGPSGELLGLQKATHLNLDYSGRFQTYADISVITTPIGRIFMAVDVDIYYPEVLRCALLEGCDYVISSQYFHPADYHQDRIVFGARSMAVSNHLFILHANNLSSCILAPALQTPNGDGFYCYPTDEKLLEADFDYTTTEKEREELIAAITGQPALGKYLSVLGK